MSETKFTPAAAYRRCVREIESLIECSEDLALDEITVESLRTAIHALKTGPELYAALEAVLPEIMFDTGKYFECDEKIVTQVLTALARARGELP